MAYQSNNMGAKGNDLKYSQSEDSVKALTPQQWDRLNLGKGYVAHPAYAAGTRKGAYKEYYNPAVFNPKLNKDGAYQWSNLKDPNFDFTTGSPVMSYTPPQAKVLPEIDPTNKPLQFAPTYTYNPNTGITTGVGGKILDIENVPSKKKGGLVGNTNYNSAIGAGSALAYGAGTLVDATNTPNSMGDIDPGKSALSEGLKDAGAGAGIGASIGSVIPGVGTVIGAGIGALGGGIYGALKGNSAAKKANADYDALLLKQKQDKENAINAGLFNTNLANQLAQRNGYSKGGKVVGKGTGTSDSIKAKVEAGSFVVPAKNAAKAKALKEELLNGDKQEKAELNQEQGKDVHLSNGEYVFNPNEVSELEKQGIDVNDLAPDSEHSDPEMAKGGLTPEKARLILKDGTIRGKNISEKQRRYFGWISDGHKCGGMIEEYSEGGSIHIDPSHRGRFTRWAKEHGMSVQQAASHVLANKDKFDAHVTKMAAFAHNFRGKKDGGNVKGYTRGGNIEDGVDPIDANKISMGKKEQDLQKRDKLLALRERILGDKNPNNKYYNQALLRDTEDKISKFNSIYGEPNNKTIPSKTGAQIQNSLGTTKTGSAGRQAVAPMLTTPNTFASSSLAKNMANQDADNAVTAPGTALGKSVAQPYVPRNAIDQAGQYDAAIAANAAAPKPNYGRALGNGLSTLVNYGIPVAQAAIGYNYLKNAGPRPIDSIDPEFNTALANARQRATYGFSPQEQTQLNNQNNNLTEANRFAARNYAGGSAGNAYNMERDAVNESFGRGLNSAVANRQLQLNKQQYADQLGLNKVELSRRLFNDKMNAWQQNQSSGANLLGTGLSNLIGANRYEQEKQAIADQNAAGNSWLNSIPQ